MSNIYFCGTYIPEFLIEKYKEYYTKEASYAGNIFYKGILHGFIDLGYKVYLTVPVNHDVFTKEVNNNYEGFVVAYTEMSNNGLFNHIKRITTNAKHLWRFINENKDGIVLFNALRIGACLSGLLICKLRGKKTVGVVTDVPGYRIALVVNGIKKRLLDRISALVLNRFDSYVLLSDSMRSIISATSKKPSVIIEGVYDTSEEREIESNPIQTALTPLTVMYAGSLHYQYGIMNLVNAILSMNHTDMILKIYGDGGARDEIIDLSHKDSRIQYCGSVSHKEIIQLERTVHVLVNPRPVEDEYVKYSFPSKIMEYMASGTPTILTNIPSLPDDYKSYAYIINDNTSSSIRNALEDLCEKDTYLIYKQKAEKARQYILENKNPAKQAQKIIELSNK